MQWFRIIKTYGITGLKAIVKLILGRTFYMKFKEGDDIIIYLPKYKSPIYLRQGTSDFATFRQVFEAKEYDVDFDFKPAVIIDAGANVGLAALYFSNRFPDARIFSIEPESSNVLKLEENIATYPHVSCIPKALHHTAGIKLNIIDEGIGKWGFTTKEGKQDVDQEQLLGQVETIDISTLIEDNDIDVVDILKVDIEGAEKTLFEKNYESWLPKTRCVIVELHDRWYPGCKESVFGAIDKYDFTHFESGENVVFINQKLMA